MSKILPFERLQRFLREGMTYAQIGKRVGLKEKSVAAVASKYGLTRQDFGPRPGEDALLRELWPTDVPMERICETLGITRSAVSNRARKLGLPHRHTLRSAKTVVPADAPPPPPPAVTIPAGLIGDVLASKGKWSALSMVAAKHGLSLAKVQQVYHQARAPR